MNFDLRPREKTIQYHKRPYKTMKVPHDNIKGHTRPLYVAEGQARAYKTPDGRDNIKQ